PRILVTAASAPDYATEQIALGGLDAEASRELAAAHLALAAGDEVAPDGRTIRAFTAGLPGAIEQLAGWIASGDSPFELPPLLVDQVSVRVHRLDVTARRVLQAVAACGSVAPRWLVESCLAPEELAALDEPTWTGLLVASEETLTIPSELVASVVWACTPADVRRRLHRRVFDALSATGAPPALLGHHAEHAGELKAAYRHSVAAAAAAERLFDDPGAARWYGRAIAMARELEARGIPSAPGELVTASLQLAAVLRRSGQPKLALGALDEAELRPLDDRQRAAAGRTRALIALDAGDPAGAAADLQAAAGAALRAGDRDALCAIYLDLAIALDGAGRTAEAEAELEQAIDVITAGQGLAGASGPEGLWRVAEDLAGRRAGRGDAAGARALASAALVLAERGGWPHARERLTALLAGLARGGRGDPTTEGG
ncbi:MAG TPA: hypothetical protein VKZ63_04885, partial [Kofleriaceae bacterium]|nr:hypothetical protein [Kofleriaceae bacterium]